MKRYYPATPVAPYYHAEILQTLVFVHPVEFKRLHAIIGLLQKKRATLIK